MYRTSILILLTFCIHSFVKADESSDFEQFILTTIPGFRLVMHNDFAQVLTEEYRGRPAFQEDFNQDGKMDWAALVINDKLKEYRAYYFLASNNDLNAELLFTRKWERSEGGVVRTPMFLKPVGESGLSSRKYNSLTEDDDSALEIEIKAAYYTSVPAIELWTGGYGDETDSSVGGMAYCSKTWYYEKGVLKSFGACD